MRVDRGAWVWGRLGELWVWLVLNWRGRSRDSSVSGPWWGTVTEAGMGLLCFVAADSLVGSVERGWRCGLTMQLNTSQRSLDLGGGLVGVEAECEEE